jgi:N6-adenosine-specific RNA methylase IME4
MVGVWGREERPDETCSECGSVYSVEVQRFPMRDHDRATCDECGHVLREWNDTLSWVYTLKERRQKTGCAPQLPEGPFDVILAHPPWKYRNSAVQGAAASHYRTTPTDELEKLPVAGRAAPTGCLLAMWATYPKLPDALRLIEAWGFEFISGFGWVKTCKDGSTPRAGIGFWTRGVAEHLLLATRGKVRPPPRPPGARPGIVGEYKFPMDVLHAPRGPHSVKPREIHEFLEEMTAHIGARRLEMFARRERPGWVVWGDEVGRGDERESEETLGLLL